MTEEVILSLAAKNLDKIWASAKKAFGAVDEIVQVGLKTAYTDYIVSTQKKYSKSKSFFIRHESVDLYSYYEPTDISCGDEIITAPTFRTLIEFSKHTVVTGTGGSGKSILIKHLFLDCIKDCCYTPILIELRDLNSDERSLDEYISHTLDIFGFSITGNFVKRAKEAGHLCFFLDGYDEVIPARRIKLKAQVIDIAKRYPGCPIVLSSRPDDVFNGIEDFSVFKMMPLTVDSARRLVEKLPYDKTIKVKFCEDLGSGLFERHKSFLSNPLLLSIMLLTYGERAQIPTKLSIFYNQAFEALFQRHDANKSGFRRDRLTNLDIQDFARVFSLFSLQTYDKRIFKMPRTLCLDLIEKSCRALSFELSPEDYLNDLTSAACLLMEDGLDISFSHRSFQEYFVATHISSAIPEIQNKLIERYWPNMGSDQVIPLLLEINPDLVERELFLPKMEAFFSDIGVKKKVGVTHAARHFKNSYQSVRIGKGTVTVVYRKNLIPFKADINFILRLAVRHCGTYEPPRQSYFEEFSLAMIGKYSKGKEIVSFKTDELTLRSPFLLDILASRGVFSTAHLDAGWRAYKMLASKHSAAIQDLDKLLGIR